MADARYNEVELGGAGPAAALQVARQVLVACAEPPIERWVTGPLSLESIPAVADVVPTVPLESDLTVPPARFSQAAELLEDPRIDWWYAYQGASRFGSVLCLTSSRRESTVRLDFCGRPGREDVERPRLERWLGAVAEAGLLPPGTRLGRLADRFFAEMRVTPGQKPPSGQFPPAIVEDGVVLPFPGWRGTSPGRGTGYGPTGFEIRVPLPPPVPLALPLLEGGGPLRLSVTSKMNAGLAAGLSEVAETRFVVSCEDVHDVDERAIDGLVRAVGTSPLRVDWKCSWPGQGGYLNGVVLLVNATEDPYIEPNHVPGRAALYLSLHPRINDRHPEEFAQWLARRAGVRLIMRKEYPQ